MKKDFMDYSSILGLTDKYSDEKLDEVIAEYKTEQESYRNLHSSAAHKHDFFKRNVDGLERMKADRKRIKIAKQFVLKPEHIKLLDVMWFGLNDSNALVGRLPSDKDIAKSLDIKAFMQDGEFFDEDSEKIDLIIEELQYAIKEIIKNALNTL